LYARALGAVEQSSKVKASEGIIGMQPYQRGHSISGFQFCESVAMGGVIEETAATEITKVPT
jgi:hypothetical protein